MTKQEAINAMLDGLWVTHTFFEPKEHITILDVNIVDENHQILHDFWDYRKTTDWDTGWSLYND